MDNSLKINQFPQIVPFKFFGNHCGPAWMGHLESLLHSSTMMHAPCLCCASPLKLTIKKKMVFLNFSPLFHLSRLFFFLLFNDFRFIFHVNSFSQHNLFFIHNFNFFFLVWDTHDACYLLIKRKLVNSRHFSVSLVTQFLQYPLNLALVGIATFPSTTKMTDILHKIKKNWHAYFLFLFLIL